MKLVIERYRIRIIPEDTDKDERDTAYIEGILGLKKEGDRVQCRRVSVMGTDALAYLEIEAKKR